MKFLNGGWLIKDGHSVKYAANVYTAKIENNKLTVFCPFGAPVHNAGQTLDGGLLTIEVTSPREHHHHSSYQLQKRPLALSGLPLECHQSRRRNQRR